MGFVTKEHLSNFTIKLLENDKTIRDELKEEIDKAQTSGGSYILPAASTTILGGVKVDGTRIKVARDYFSIPVYISSQNDSINCNTKDYTPKYTSDGLHPNEVWNAIRTRKIASWIKTL